MLVNSCEAKHLDRLFGFMLQGENLAHNFSYQQSRLFDNTHARRFLKQQSRHELIHVHIFKAGCRFVNYRGSKNRPTDNTMRAYARLLDEALLAGNQAETITGLQVILEGFGDVILERLNGAIEKRGNTLARIRHLILGQEDAHHHFGLQKLEQCVQESPELKEYLLKRSDNYFELIQQFLYETEEVFSHFHIDPQTYHENINQNLPAWLEFKA
jgi:hypothetical protein